MTKGQQAEELFFNGQNCCQSVLCSFTQEVGITDELAAKLASGFGGGVGRLRQMCGAVSGMVMVLSAVKGHSHPAKKEERTNTYELVRSAIKQFEDSAGSINCAELLNIQASLQQPESAAPSDRTDEYYKKRPCAHLCHLAASITQQHLY